MEETPPPKCTENCKVARCSICSRCSRCGCRHDGVTPARAAKRKRGERGKSKNRAKNPRREVNTYKRGDYEESPMDTQRPANRERTDFILRSSFTSSNPAVVTMGKCTKVRDILRAFDLDDKIEYADTYLPPLSSRQNPSTWQQANDKRVRAARRLVCEIVQRVCNVFCGNDSEAGVVLAASVLRSQIDQPTDENETFARTIGECYASAQKGSKELRVLRACLSHIPRSKLKQLSEQLPRFSVSCDSYAVARQDLLDLKQGNPIEITKRSVQRFDPDVVRQAVAYILSGENVAFLSWGTKRIKVEGCWKVLPAIMRRRSKTHMFEGYHEASPVISASNVLSRATFFRIASLITAGDAQLRKAIDYVVGFLVNDPVDVLQRVLTTARFEYQDTEPLLADVEVMCAYLKYGFDSRVRKSSSCILHHIEYGLDATYNKKHHKNLCVDCTKLFQFYEHVHDRLVASGGSASAIKAVEDCSLKAKLYLGHRLRVLNQQDTIAKLVGAMKARCIAKKRCDEVLVLLDFKMKLEPMYYREKTVDHYGKRGMSWHGALVMYWDYQCDEDEAAVEQKLYYDHISSGDTKQDRECVLSMVEAVLIRLRKDLPNVNRIVLQSDNAPCYQNMLLPLIFPFLSVIYGVEISRFLHTETQDGKSILDAHFARAMDALKEWVRQRHNCITPTQAVIGLSSNGGLPNTAVELVEHDREQLRATMELALVMEKQLKKFASRANDIEFSFLSSEWRNSKAIASDYRTCPPFKLRIFEYSGIGNGVNVLCTPATATCKTAETATTAVATAVTMAATMAATTATTTATAVTTRVDCSVEAENILIESEELSDESDEDQTIEWNADQDDDPDDSSEDEDSNRIEEAPDTIEMAIVSGNVTGIKIATHPQLRRRVKNWRRRPASLDVDCVDVLARDAVTYAARVALEMHHGGEIYVQNVDGPYRVRYAVEDTTATTVRHQFGPGWAIRPMRGQMYGERYIEAFRGEIRDMFLRGASDKSNKMGPGRMLEELQKRHPHRFDLPTENEIRQEISKLYKKSTDARAPHDAETMPAPAKASTRKKEYGEFFVGLLQENTAMMRKEAVSLFQAKFPDSELSVAQIGSKFQNTKTKLRKAVNN